MALARNLNRRPVKSKLKIPKFGKKWAWGVVFVALLAGTYGIINLSRIALPGKKSEITYQTGDRPLAQKTAIWVKAEGGLYLRQKPESGSKILVLIPNGTSLTADETLDDWYRVTYVGKTGWVSKSYVTTVAPAENPTKDYKTLIDKENGFSIRYPTDWGYQNYGSNPASKVNVLIGFGPELSASFDAQNLPPITLKVSTKSATQLGSEFKNQGGVASPLQISGLAAQKFVINNASGVQVTSYVVSKGAISYVLEENGGYAEELLRLVGTMTLS